MLAGALQERSIWDGPVAVAASPVGAPGVVTGVAVTVAVAALVSVSVWPRSSAKVTRTLRVVPRSAATRR